MSQYPAPPPSYGSGPAPKPYRDDALDPLLGPRSSAGPSSGFYDQPAEGDVPDDFKYGTTVSESSPEVRNAFVRKVYSILFCQILATCVVAGGIGRSPDLIPYLQTHTWTIVVPTIAALVNMGLLFWKRHSHPWNLVLLSTFTIFEAFTLGILVAFFDNTIVLQALLITLGVFLGLTLFTFQSDYDFSGLGPWLFGALVALLMTGVVGIFIPFGRTMDIVYASGGCLIFSGYIVYDTYMINKRLSPDEYILGAIGLYLDFINLFINILRLLNDLQDR
jgi:hypothetical protein